MISILLQPSKASLNANKMASKIETLIRTVRGLTEDRRFDSLEDPHGLLKFSEQKLRTYRENPYLSDLDQPCQLIGVKDGVVVAGRNSYPSRIVAQGKSYNIRISGSVFVDPQARASLMAISMLNKALKFEDGSLNMNCMLSIQNQKFYRLYGSSMFELAEFDAGGRWNKYYKPGNPSGWKKYAAKVLNFAVILLNKIFDGKRWCGLPDWRVEEKSISDSDFLKNASDLVASDVHSYREDITADWMKWTLENDFLAVGNHGRMFGVYDGENFVGFALTRRNPKSGKSKIYEWQLTKEYEDKEAEMLSLVAKELFKVDSRVGVQVGTDSVNTIASLAKRFPRLISNYVVVTIAKDSPFNDFAGIKESRNWRLRPGMGDAAHWCA